MWPPNLRNLRHCSKLDYFTSIFTLKQWITKVLRSVHIFSIFWHFDDDISSFKMTFFEAFFWQTSLCILVRWALMWLLNIDQILNFAPKLQFWWKSSTKCHFCMDDRTLGCAHSSNCVLGPFISRAIKCWSYLFPWHNEDFFMTQKSDPNSYSGVSVFSSFQFKCPGVTQK